MLSEDFVQQNAAVSFVRVKSVKRVKNEDVYCLATKNGNFVANGIVVKNCDALRYALFTHFFNRSSESIRPEDIDKWEREAGGWGPELPGFFR